MKKQSKHCIKYFRKKLFKKKFKNYPGLYYFVLNITNSHKSIFAFKFKIKILCIGTKLSKHRRDGGLTFEPHESLDNAFCTVNFHNHLIIYYNRYIDMFINFGF